MSDRFELEQQIMSCWNVDEAMSNAVWDIESHFYGVEE